MANKKIADILKELDISFEELKSTTDRMGIEVKSNRGSISDVDAERVIDTISKLKGLSGGLGEDVPKAGPKKMPVISKGPVPKMKPPVAKAMPKKKEEPEDAPEKEKAEGVSELDVAESEKAGDKAGTEAEKTTKKKAEDAAETETLDAKAEKGAEEKPAKKTAEKKAEDSEEAEASDAKAEEGEEKPAKKKVSKKKVDDAEETKPEPAEDYENAPNKPMRFKKIYDASNEPEPEAVPKTTRRKKKAQDEGAGADKGAKKGDRDAKPTRTSAKGQDSSADKSAQGAQKTGKGGKSKKFFDNKDREKDRENSRRRFERKEQGGAKNTHYYDEHSLEKQTRHKRKNRPKPVDPEIEIEELLPEGTVAVTAPITVAGLSEQAEISTTKIIMSLMKLGIMATINQTLDKDTIELLAEDLGLQVVVTEEVEVVEEPGLDLREDSENELEPRAPIITVMGHVDHGKTSLLDAIRNTNVTAGESGGITQHIGAYEVEISGKKIVFLDTPGHEAFTTMRARGAQITDIAVLVVAADDSVKPQTIESISHAKAAGVPMIVAINKMDKPGANPDKVKADLSEHGVLVEDWGGNVISVPVSAKTGEGITDLLEMILLQAEVLELKANPDRLAMGTVVEARLDKAKGPIATLLVTNGTLKSGQSVVAGTCAGKIRVMTNYKGEEIRKAVPATPVEILGLSDVPMAGDAFNAVKDDKVAREIAESRRNRMREEVMARNASMTLDKLFSQIQEGEAKELNLIVKADVQGSVGAIIQSLEKLDTADVHIRVIHSGVGTITESDVKLAETSNAIIIGFNVRPTSAVTSQAQDAEVEVRLYRVIYDIIDDIQDAMKGMLDPEFREEVLGLAEVRDTFKVPNLGVVAGAYVTEGKIQRNAQIRLVRDGIVIHEGVISSLRRFKDDVKEVATGYECGIGIENYNDIKPGDEIECFEMVEIER